VEVGLVAGLRVSTFKVGYELTTQLFPGGKRPLGEVHEPRLGRASQGHGEVVGHDGIIPSCGEDGDGVDL
jgi:hypothetical protein